MGPDCSKLASSIDLSVSPEILDISAVVFISVSVFIALKGNV